MSRNVWRTCDCWNHTNSSSVSSIREADTTDYLQREALLSSVDFLSLWSMNLGGIKILHDAKVLDHDGMRETISHVLPALILASPRSCNLIGSRCDVPLHDSDAKLMKLYSRH